jgi:hypothetical protein
VDESSVFAHRSCSRWSGKSAAISPLVSRRIYSLVTEAGVEFGSEAFRMLVRSMFDAREVPYALIAKLPEQREFHRQQEAALRDSVSGGYLGFDYYFDFTIAETVKLQLLWNP